MWDCQESHDRILEECRYSMLATDFLAGGLLSLERANLEMDFLAALAELFPSCEAFFFNISGKLFKADEIRNNQIEGQIVLSVMPSMSVSLRFKVPTT